MSILRWVGRNHKGKNGEALYPGGDDAELSYEIDSLCDTLGDQTSLFVCFLFEQNPGYKDKDEHFTQWIVKHFPKFLAGLEERLAKGTRYLCSDNMTIADIAVGSLFFSMVYNDSYENCHIMQAVVNKYPKVVAWMEIMKNDFEETLKNGLQSAR